MTTRARDNPFSTHRLDALRYRPQGESWEDMLGRLEAMGWRGSVVGPEGSGKTALLHDLAPRLKAIGLRVENLRLGFGQRTLPVDTLRRLSSLLDGEAALLLDGAEQLGPMGWRAVARSARRAGALVITLHRPGRLPTWVWCDPSEALFLELVSELTGGCSDEAEHAARKAFAAHGGNVRSSLLSLYDAYSEGRLGAPRRE
jgi:hypothetical protein